MPLNINNAENPAVISIVNHPKYESAYSLIIATIMHTVIKQMSVRNQKSSFVMKEEAPTLLFIPKSKNKIPSILPPTALRNLVKALVI